MRVVIAMMEARNDHLLAASSTLLERFTTVRLMILRRSGTRMKTFKVRQCHGGLHRSSRSGGRRGRDPDRRQRLAPVGGYMMMLIPPSLTPSALQSSPVAMPARWTARRVMVTESLEDGAGVASDDRAVLRRER